METVHVHLRVENGRGSFGLEPVHAVPLGDRKYRVEHSPGLAYEVAAGDEIEVGDEGTFRVLRRGGNLAVRVFSESPVVEFLAALAEDVRSKLAGRLDGAVEKGLVFTIPVSAGFSRVEDLFNGFGASRSGVAWEYGNVYDDKGEPLGWWKHDV